MSLKDAYEKEKRVILYGQSTRFRLIKYSILLPLFGLLWAARGWYVALQVIGVLFLCALVVHAFYRYMTDGWSKKWGGFVPLDR